MKKVTKNKIDRRQFLKIPLAISLFPFFSINNLLAGQKFQLTDAKPIKIAVSMLEVSDNYRMPLVDPYVEHRMRRSPSSALASWAHTILRPAGLDGTAKMSITKASASITNIGGKTKFLDLFRNNQASRINIILSGKLEIIKERSGSSGYVNVEAKFSKTAPEAASVNQLEKIWDESLVSAIGKFDSEFRKQILDLSQFLL